MSDHVSEIEKLRRLLAQERREKEAAKAREEAAKTREDVERRKNRMTTLDEYLHNCHFHLYIKLGLADKSKLSTGFTKVDGKYYPKWLRPWNSFINAERRQNFEEIKRVCGNRRLFHQESTTRDLGTTISRKLAGNENAIEHFEKVAVEDPVWEILSVVRDEEELRKVYQFMGLRFSNNMREFTQQGSDIDWLGEEGMSEERLERRRRTGPNKRVASEQRVKPPLTKPDGAGIRTNLDGDESIAFVYDYKAAHKVAVKYLKPAITKEKLFIEVMERMNSNKSKSDAERKLNEAEEWIAMALTQVFDYMVNYGIAYGYVAAGQSLVFLYIDRANPQTLYYHLCVPAEDVGKASAGDVADKASHTAVAQLASFCLLSLRSEALEGVSLDAALQKAKMTLRKWREPYEDTALEAEGSDSTSTSASASQESQESNESNFTSKAAPASRELSLRSKSCKPAAVLRRDEDEDEDEEDRPDGNQSSTWTRAGVNKLKEAPLSGSSEDENAQVSDSAPAKQYCTQACLLGLKRGWDLDDKCPNMLLHRTTEGSTRHPLDAGEFARLVGERLRQNPYRDCKALNGRGKFGAIGVLFKLELAPYGYTFVGKGTLSGHLRRLQHESLVYERLERLQGEVVPVYLGIAHLAKGYVFPGGARVVHMMLMSWGGEMAAEAGLPDLEAEVLRSSQAVWDEGVGHNDERDPNLLWNDERSRVMLIDFDRAALRPAPKYKRIVSLSGGKRKRQRDSLRNHPQKRDFQQGYLQSVE